MSMWSPPLESTASEWIGHITAHLRVGEELDMELAPQPEQIACNSVEDLQCSVSDGCEESDPTLAIGVPGSPSDGYGAGYSFLEADPIAGEPQPFMISCYDYSLPPLQLSASVPSSSRSLGLSAVPIGGNMESLPATELFCGELLCGPRVNPQEHSPLFQSPGHGSTPTPSTPQLAFIKEVSKYPRRHTSRQSLKDPRKNQHEHERVMLKNQKLQQLKHVVIQCGCRESTEGKRWTEKQILEKTITCIKQLHLQAHSHSHVPTTPKPFYQKSSGGSSLRKKQPNIFLSFSEVMRSSFLQVMKRTFWPDLEQDERQKIKIDNRHVTKLLSAVWNGLAMEEKHLHWRNLNVDEKKPYMEKAKQIILENLRQGAV